MGRLRLWTLLLVVFAFGCGSAETAAPPAENTETFAVDQSKPQPPEWKVRGETLANKEDYQGAIAIYDAALKESPDNIEILIARAEARQYSGDIDGAWMDWQAVLDTSPTNGRAWLGKGDCLIILGKHAEAITALDKAIEAGSRDYRTYHTRGMARHTIGRSREALADFNEAIRLNPENTGIRVERGYVLTSLGEHEKAIADFTADIEANPSDARALNFRALSYQALGDEKREIADIEEAIRRSPNEPHYCSYLGILHADKRDFAAAAKWLNTALELDLKARQVAVPPIEPKTLSEDDLEFGRTQAAQLLRDRPVLAAHLQEGDILWNWIVRQFAGESAGYRCRWNPDPPDDWKGLTSGPQDGVGAIQVAQFEDAEVASGKQRTFDAVFSTVVFELYNHAAHADFDANWQRLMKGEIDPVTYARLSLETESLSAIHTCRHFCTTYLEWAKAGQFMEIDARNWCLDAWLPADSIYRNTLHRSDSRWEHWLEHGIEAYAHGIFEREGPAAALKTLNAELAKQGISTNIQARINYFRARCFNEAGDKNAEISALDESIRLDPTYAKAYFARSGIWHSTNEPNKELADLAKGIEFEPSAAWACVRRAEIFVLNDDPKIRSGKAAVENATKACELTKWEDVSSILMLAASHAEAGNRDEAVKWQKKAAEMSPAENRGPVEAVIPIYEAGKTLRDAPLPPQSTEPAGVEATPAK
jgi:tetratricopeptide (TPR) repeat protein